MYYDFMQKGICIYKLVWFYECLQAFLLVYPQPLANKTEKSGYFGTEMSDNKIFSVHECSLSRSMPTIELQRRSGSLDQVVVSANDCAP